MITIFIVLQTIIDIIFLMVIILDIFQWNNQWSINQLILQILKNYRRMMEDNK